MCVSKRVKNFSRSTPLVGGDGPDPMAPRSLNQKKVLGARTAIELGFAFRVSLGTPEGSSPT
jgi:hypothetical protein